MGISFLRDVFREKANSEAIIWKGHSYHYSWLDEKVVFWLEWGKANGIRPFDVVLLQGEFSPSSISILLALIELECIVVPLSADRAHEQCVFANTALVVWILEVDSNDKVRLVHREETRKHSLYDSLRKAGHSGIVFFTSGSTGISKAVVHDLEKLLKKYTLRRYDLRTLAFLLFDHIGGFDTLFYVLSNGSALVVPEVRTPLAVCQSIERYKVEVLPVSPSFLNLLLIGEVYKEYELNSLKFISYGAEVMPSNTLQRCMEIFPKVRFLQKYGATEIGTMRSKSDQNNSVWVQIGGEGYNWRIVDGLLQIKCDSAMVGYLNAPSPFTEDGWFITGDAVEQDGENLRILGRMSDIINVGGQKVYPAEVENAICEMEGVADATVYGEKNQLLGSIVCARVQLAMPVEKDEFVKKLKTHCKSRLERYKLPLKITFSSGSQTDARSKKMRRFMSEGSDLKSI
ncbi:MAG TPA: fatty acid--CoA ligase family protein [Nitrospira sp.]|nr:fatty acid--CoA ligase family protein [Nitrospira sp.]